MRKWFGWLSVGLVGLLLGTALGWVVWGQQSSARPHHRMAPITSTGKAVQGKPNAADIGFCQDMTVHHNQALQMATFALVNSQDQEIKRLALQILTSQATEKGLMSGWLILWEAPELPSGPHMAWMGKMDHQSMGHQTGSGLMPGMASMAEMTRLGRLKGRDFDIFFLQLMIRHHGGGIEMATAAADQAATPAVRGLALEMARVQTQENGLMLAQLKDLGGAPKP